MIKTIKDDIPEWVNKKQFHGILTNKFKDFKEIQHFKAFSALNGGENYVTKILRIQIDMRMQDDSFKRIKFILKIPLPNDPDAENEYHDLFVSEVDMYANVIPELENIYHTATAGQNDVQFKPMHFRFVEAPPQSDYILLEDLQCKGFKNANRLEGLDQLHTEGVLEKLAQWHAASARRTEIYGDYKADYRNSYITADNREMIESMNKSFATPFIECLQSYGLSDLQKIQIENYMKILTDLYIKCGEIDDNQFNALNHGDFWANNIMFQYHDNNAVEDDGGNSNTKKIKRIIFIDFQLPKFGSPAQDLFCFLMTSPKFDIKLTKFDAFIKYYHEKLLQNLKLINYEKPLPTLNDLHNELKKNGMWGFIDAQRMLAVTLLDPSENSNIETFMNDNAEGIAFKKRMFYNPRYVEQIEKILPWLIERDYLHCD